MTNYDSREDTETHIMQVQLFLLEFARELRKRGRVHDASKLQAPEKEAFDVITPRLKSLTYGSEEYRASLQELSPALEHHYANNSHHPEHYPNGVNGMSLLDVIEMLADWKAATLRHANGDILKSLAINRERFGLSDQLYEILVNTVREMGWDK